MYNYMHIDYLKTINTMIEKREAYLIINYFLDTDSRMGQSVELNWYARRKKVVINVYCL